jgi:hypothetical protein
LGGLFGVRGRWGFAVVTSFGLAATAIAASGVSAQAAPSTKYYTAAVTPTSVDSLASHEAFVLTLTNCDTHTANCGRSSQQTFGSADIQVDPSFTSVSASTSAPGWFVVQPVVGGLIELRSDNNVAIAPGSSVIVNVTADTPSTGAYTWPTQVKQSNNFSGTGNDFTISGSQPQVLVGFPDHLVFVTQPSNVQVTTKSSTSYMCPAPSVQVVTADGTPVTVGDTTARLAADTAFGDPSLGGPTTANAVSGLATFGDCTTGLYAKSLGGGYQLSATAIWTLGSYQTSLATMKDSAPFDVVQLLTKCQAAASCNGSTAGKHTEVDVSASSATTTDELEVAVGIDSLANTTCQPFSLPSGLEVVRVLVDHRDKTVVITFDKYLVNQIPDNGTPLFDVCMAAPWGDWATDGGGSPTFNTVTGEYEGVLPTCGAARLMPYNPCVVDRSKHAANEIVEISIPYEPGRADPKLW